jgi:hypothetical protein
VIFQKILKKLPGLEMLYVICLEMKRKPCCMKLAWFFNQSYTYICVCGTIFMGNPCMIGIMRCGFSLLQENEGATLIVTAQFSVASSRSIVLQFQEVCLISLIPIFIHIFLSSHNTAFWAIDCEYTMKSKKFFL